MRVHLNGTLVDAADAQVSVFDRGFLLADGVYEGLRAEQGRVVALTQHLERMNAGFDALRIRGFDAAALREPTFELLRANGLKDAFIYWHVTRGAPGHGPVARRRVPPEDLVPTVFGFASPLPQLESYATPRTVSAELLEDSRWLRGQIKAVSLLGSVVAAIEASEAGCEEAVLHRDGLVTEGITTNVVAVFGDEVVTPTTRGASLLPGVTRALLLRDLGVDERPISVEEIEVADEIMLIGTATVLISVVALGGRPVGSTASGKPGPVACRLARRLIDVSMKYAEGPADE